MNLFTCEKTSAAKSDLRATVGGSNSLINVNKNLVDRFEGLSEELTVTYTVDGSTCQLFAARNGNNRVYFALNDHTCSDISFSFNVRKDGYFLELSTDYITDWQHSANKLEFGSKTCNPLGETKRTHYYLYGIGNTGGFLVLEEKIKKGDQKPFMVTLSHYYAATRGDFFGDNRVDIGLSIVLNIQQQIGHGLCYTLDGPHQHPSSALFYMFDIMLKNRQNYWPTGAPICPHGAPICPHCVHIQWQQSQRRRRNGMQYWSSEESEEYNTEPNPPTPPQLLGPRTTISSSVVSNDGSIRGNNNGNLFVRTRRLFIGRK